jgi:hypothetical protein
MCSEKADASHCVRGRVRTRGRGEAPVIRKQVNLRIRYAKRVAELVLRWPPAAEHHAEARSILARMSALWMAAESMGRDKKALRREAAPEAVRLVTDATALLARANLPGLYVPPEMRGTPPGPVAPPMPETRSPVRTQRTAGRAGRTKREA